MKTKDDGPVEYRCRWCDRFASWETLSLYGARCRPCYEAWTREAPSGPVLNERQKAELMKRLGRTGRDQLEEMR